VLWLDGGLEDADTLYYSRPGRIEEFAADGFLRLGGQTAGGITAIFPHYAALVVFRENAVDVVTGNAAEGFQSSTIATGVTCRAPHSVAAVPGLGLVFLALDGVYAIVGGLQGGATFDVVKLTTAQRELIDRITPDLHPKAVGVFSPKSREYHVYAPADGQDRPSLGLVLHVDLLETSLWPWSTRTGFPVGAIATMYDGTVVFGHHTGVEAGAGSEAGVFLITQRRAMGGTVGGDNAFSYGNPPTSVYRSTWNDFSDAQQHKQILYVTVWVLTTGQPTVTVKHLKDFSLQAVEERSYLAQPPDAANLPTFDTAPLRPGRPLIARRDSSRLACRLHRCRVRGSLSRCRQPTTLCSSATRSSTSSARHASSRARGHNETLDTTRDEDGRQRHTRQHSTRDDELAVKYDRA